MNYGVAPPCQGAGNKNGERIFMTTMKAQCFLIDSLLEKTQEEEEAVDLMKRYPSTSSHPEEVDDEEEDDEEEEETEPEEAEPSRLTQLINDMMDKEKKDIPTPSVIPPRPQFPLGNPMEYLSKLQMMQHAINMSAFALRQPFQTPLLPLMRKDLPLFPRPQLIRPPRVVAESTRSGNTKKYRCDICDKTFSRSNTLITHKRIHTGEKPFKCEHCGRAFRQPGNLTRHRLTHTTVKPYVCIHCDKAFNRASNLHTHQRTHNTK